MFKSIIAFGSLIYLRGFLVRLKEFLGKSWRATLPGVVSAVLCVYFHSEYLHWVEVTGDKKYVTFSFIFKNLILLALAIKYIYLPLRRPLEEKVEIPELAQEAEVEESGNEDKLEQVFKKLRKKEELTTKTEQILNAGNHGDP